MQTHKKAYDSKEFHERYQIFKSNLDYIRSYNSKNTGITLRMNQFGDLTSDEFAR